MTTERVKRTPIELRHRSPWPIVASLVVLVLLGLIVHNARYGAVSPRIRNPNAVGLHPIPGALFGFQHWIVLVEIFSYLTLLTVFGLVHVAVARAIAAHPQSE